MVAASTQALVVRPLVRSDRQLIEDSLQYTSMETLYRRFHAAKSSLSARELDYLTDIDGERHVALVAVDPEHDGRLAGVARWVRDQDQPQAAELAIMVCDPYQGQGVGRTLMVELMQRGRDLGLRRLRADVQHGNQAMMALMAGVCGNVRMVRREGAGAVYELELD